MAAGAVLVIMLHFYIEALIVVCFDLWVTRTGLPNDMVEPANPRLYGHLCSVCPSKNTHAHYEQPVLPGRAITIRLSSLIAVPKILYKFLKY